MAYEVNKSNGEILVNLIDGEVDNTTTPLSLLGKNYLGYGELVAENFVRMLENFSSSVEPVSPMTGQLWFNTAENRLAVRDTGPNWKTLAQLNSSATRPTEGGRAGDFWWDASSRSLKIYVGTTAADQALPGYNQGWVNVGGFEDGSGISFALLMDTNGTTHKVMRINVNGICVAVISTDAEFTIAASHAISGFTVIGKGINMNSTGNTSASFNLNAFKLRGISIEAEFADVAEIYVADAAYEPGTLVSLGGAADVTLTSGVADQNIFGIVSSRPAYLMNAKQKHEKNALPIAVAGRIPVRVTGVVNKGDRLIASETPGVARSSSVDAPAWSIIGRSLGNYSGDGIGIIEATVGVR